MHPHGDVTDPGPRVQPRAEGMQRTVIRGHRAPGEADSRTQELATFDVTEVRQSLKEGLSQARVSARVELREAYSRDLRRLLRLDDERRTQRPQRQSAEECAGSRAATFSKPARRLSTMIVNSSQPLSAGLSAAMNARSGSREMMNTWFVQYESRRATSEEAPRGRRSRG